MLYDDKYEKTEERMLDVIDTVQELTKDRFIASLYIRKCNPLDVEIKLAEVRRCLDIVHGEALRLAKLELTYNLDFAVDVDEWGFAGTDIDMERICQFGRITDFIVQLLQIFKIVY